MSMKKIELNEKAYKIMIVDDVDVNRYSLKNVVEKMNQLPMLAENAEQALKILEKVTPDLIILDIYMPGMSGFEFCETIKNDRRYADIPVVFISGFDDPADIKMTFKLGGEDYITKPFMPEEVVARVRPRLVLKQVLAQ